MSVTSSGHVTLRNINSVTSATKRLVVVKSPLSLPEAFLDIVITFMLYYARPKIGGGIKRWRCLTSVCLTSVAYIGPKSRTERPRKTKIGTEVSHDTRDSDTISRSKGQGHQAALLTAVLTLQTATAVSMGTYWLWETTATLRSARRREALRRRQREERGGGISWRPPAYRLLDFVATCIYFKFPLF